MMRACLFRKVLGKLEQHTPDFLRSLEIQILLNLTARAFHAYGMSIRRMQADTALEKYAQFTVSCMNSGKADPAALYRSAFAAGRLLRLISGFQDPADLQRLVFYLYRNIRITMTGELPGGMIVPDCYFSRFYTPKQCAVMSLMDSGIIAGLFGEGRLKFTARLTSGCEACKACFITHL